MPLRMPCSSAAAAVALLVAMLAIAGCTGAPLSRTPPPAETLLHDELFALEFERPSAAQVLALDDAMLRFMHDRIELQARGNGLRHALIDALYNRSSLKLVYDTTMTRSAAEAFEARAGNCLSLVLMTSAFAKQLGIGVQYNEVMVDRSWSRSAGIDFSSGHVNLTLGPSLGEVGHGYDLAQGLTIDFLPQADLARQRSRPIDEDTVLAMYLNNRAAELLADGRIDEAYGHASAAVLRQPNFLAARNTLAIIYLQHGNLVEAEQVLRQVVTLEPANTTALANLAAVLEEAGRSAEASVLRERLAAIEPQPPFHFLDLGIAAVKRGDYAAARDDFRREIARSADYHEPHFWLGLADLHLGNLGEARREIALALEQSPTRGARDLYAAKLAHLKSLEEH